MKSLVYPTYFPSIAHYVAISNAKELVLEVEDNFQKQSYRNRCLIYSPNGIQLLNVPVIHSKNERQKTKDAKISYDFDWQKQHFKSLEMGYRSSPFFEYYEDEIATIIYKKNTFLLDLNLEIFELINKCMIQKISYTKTLEYFKEVNDIQDFRYLTQEKKTDYNFEKYTQVFEERFGFIHNLSILDLLFAEGKHAFEYLKNQMITKTNNNKIL